MRRAQVYMYEEIAGILTEDDEGFHFKYNSQYLESKNAEPISLTMSLQAETKIYPKKNTDY